MFALVVNLECWFQDPFSWRQIISWFLLIVSLILIFLGVRSLQRQGDVDPQRVDPGLVGIEKTTQLVTTGIYSCIRHPFYASLLFLVWGVFFKHVYSVSFTLTLLASLWLYVTARVEEGENLTYFGAAYREYMLRTRMFIPFVI